MPTRKRRSRTPYLDAAVRVFNGDEEFSCLAINWFAPPPRPTLLPWGRATRLYRYWFAPPGVDHDWPIGWWNSSFYSGKHQQARIFALLLAHEMSLTGDLQQGEN